MLKQEGGPGSIYHTNNALCVSGCVMVSCSVFKNGSYRIFNFEWLDSMLSFKLGWYKSSLFQNFFEWTPPSNTIAAQSEGFERNKCLPRIVAMATKCGTRTHVQMISDDSHYASDCLCWTSCSHDWQQDWEARILLTVSSNRHCLTHLYRIQPSLMSPGFPKK